MEAIGRICICRLCALEKDSFLRIYDDEGYKLAVGIKISKYLQIQVSFSISYKMNMPTYTEFFLLNRLTRKTHYQKVSAANVTLSLKSTLILLTTAKMLK